MNLRTATVFPGEIVNGSGTVQVILRTADATEFSAWIRSRARARDYQQHFSAKDAERRAAG
ncbi:hypothetical protein [Streptomyces solincola]|nr:hypothetical protein [Streptomyces solincola]